MRSECIEAVAQAIGRSITQREAQDIETRILRGMSERARQDPAAWRALTEAQRLRAGAEGAAAQLTHEAAKTKQRVALTILAHDKVTNRYATLVREGLKPFKAVARILDDANHYSKGLANEYFSRLIDTMDAVHPRWLGMVEDARQAADLVREIFANADGHTGNKLAQKGARAWLDVVESMRQRFNAAGGDVGKLAYSYLPHPHDALRVLRAGKDQWVRDTLPLLDRSRYIDAAGNLMNDADLTAMLEGAWDTITTGGLNKLEPGASIGGSMRANRGSAQRVIHFKDAEAYLTYAAKYNKGGILSAMQGHVARLAKDIALVEEFGPNPNSQWRFLHQTAEKTGDSDLVGPFLVRTEDMWQTLNGFTGSIANPRLAAIAQGIRNVETFGKLGSAFVSSITDIPTYFVTTAFNRLGFGESTVNLIRAFGGDTKDFSNRAGLVAESMISDMNRWAEANIGRGWTAKLANATMKLSLLEAWTDAIRRGFSITQMGALGKLSRLDWGALEEGDRARLTRQGVTETDFKVWQLAQPESWRGSAMLTAPAVRAVSEADLSAHGLTLRDQNRAVSKLLGSIIDESEYASLGNDLQTRAAVTRGTQKGTVNGEMLRSFMLFKGFPAAMLSRHWARMADTWQSGGKVSSVAYGAAMITGLTVFGAIAMELKDLIAGKDPRDMTTPKFWGAAFAQGGGLGVFGDLLYTGLGGDNRAGTPNWASFFGPVLGSGVDLANLTVGNLGKVIHGQNTHFGAEALQFTRGHLPFINMWYAKAAIDHAVLQDMQEYLSPGYLERMREKAEHDWGQQFWWRPGQTEPVRMPNFGKAVGE
jgi:hypothetical protein